MISSPAFAKHVSDSPSLENHNCCHKEESRFDFLLNILEKISAVALGVFSAYVNWRLFTPFFFAGMCIGIYSYVQDKSSCDQIRPVSSCAQSFLEQLTGVKLPRIISLIANIAVTICHIDHHEDVFVPIIGISLGAGMGKIVSPYGVLAYEKMQVYFSRTTSLMDSRLVSLA